MDSHKVIKAVSELLSAALQTRDAEIAKLTLQRDLATRALSEAKSNLMHHRRFGTDTLQAWKNAATRAEGDIEDALATINES